MPTYLFTRICVCVVRITRPATSCVGRCHTRIAGMNIRQCVECSAVRCGGSARGGKPWPNPNSSRVESRNSTIGYVLTGDAAEVRRFAPISLAVASRSDRCTVGTKLQTVLYSSRSQTGNQHGLGFSALSGAVRHCFRYFGSASGRHVKFFLFNFPAKVQPTNAFHLRPHFTLLQKHYYYCY